LNDFKQNSKYETSCFAEGTHLKALKEICKYIDGGVYFVGYHPRLCKEADYAGIDGYFGVIHPTNHEAYMISVDFKFRRIDYGDVLFNVVNQRGGDGWALNNKKKNQVVVNICAESRIANLVTHEDMFSDEFQKFLKKQNYVSVRSGKQKNVMLTYEQCKFHLPNFIGPVKF